MYLFDTDVLTTPLKPQPSSVLLARLSNLPPNQQLASAITIAEIVYGACRSQRREYHLDRLRHLLLPTVQILPFDTAAAECYGELRALLEAAGTPVALHDLQIASTAMAHGLTLVTGNVRHFQRIPGLRIENWLVGNSEEPQS